MVGKASWKSLALPLSMKIVYPKYENSTALLGVAEICANIKDLTDAGVVTPTIHSFNLPTESEKKIDPGGWP